MIDLQKLNLMFDTLFSDPDIEEKFWDWYTNRNKNISQPPVSGELPPAIKEIENLMERWHLARDNDGETLQGINDALVKIGLLGWFNKQ